MAKTKGFKIRFKLVMATLGEWFINISMSALAVAVAFRLGNMQLDGLLTVGGVGLGLSFAFTSLMYNRARAHAEGRTQRRSLRAAELSLRGTMAFAATVVYCGVVFFFLSESGYEPTSAHFFPKRLAPVLAVVPAVLSLVYAYAKFSQAVRLTLHGVLGLTALSTTRRFIRAIKHRVA